MWTECGSSHVGCEVVHRRSRSGRNLAVRRNNTTISEGSIMLRRLFSLIVFLTVVTGCFWFYRTLTLASPHDEAWTAINSRLPDPLRIWSCQTVRKRLMDPGPAPAGCQNPGDW